MQSIQPIRTFLYLCAMTPGKHSDFHPGKRRQRRSRFSYRCLKLLRQIGIGLGCLLGIWLIGLAVNLGIAATRPVDAFFVLGGSIQREIHVAELVKRSPEIPVLISSGSPDPCIWAIFQRENAPMQQVWIENCADSTFDNFFFSTPILQNWGVRKVQVITSETHLPRAMWLAKILLGAHGIWVKPDIVDEQGVPGNQESVLKTGLDVVRSLGWAIAGQFHRPQCDKIRQLATTNLEQWQGRRFRCERQGNVEI